MEKHEIIRELAQVIYDKGIKNDTYVSAEKDWMDAERMYEFFEDNEAPRDWKWQSDWEDYKEYYDLYLRCKGE